MIAGVEAINGLTGGSGCRSSEKERMTGTPPSAAADDKALLTRVARGETAALGTLYDRYGRLVFSVALRVTGDRESAEEITQDTFLRLWQQAGRFDPERGSCAAWLATIAQRRAIDELRGRRGTSRRREVALPELVADEQDLGLADLSQLRADLQSALAELPPPQREAIELSYFGGLSRQEIAAQAACPLPTIHTRLRLGMEKLRTILLREEREGGRDER